MKKEYTLLFLLLILSCNLTSTDNENLFFAKKDRYYGFINSEGILILPFKYSFARAFSEGMAQISTNDNLGEYGFINNSGQIIVKPIYQSVQSFSQELAAVKKDNLWGYINKTGDVVIDFQYSSASSFSEGLAAVAKEDKYGYIDKKGNVVIPFLYDTAFEFSEGYAVIGFIRGVGKKGFKLGYINKDNELVIDTIYGFANSFKNGYAVVTLIEGPFQLLDKTGKDVISDIKHGGVKDYQEGLLPIYYNGGYCYMTIDKEVVIDSKYRAATPFNEGRAFVTFDNLKWGIIDKQGNTVCESLYSSPSKFENGLARVQLQSENLPNYIYINYNCEIVWPKIDKQ